MADREGQVAGEAMKRSGAPEGRTSDLGRNLKGRGGAPNERGEGEREGKCECECEIERAREREGESY